MKTITMKAGKRIFRVKDCRGFSSIRGLMFDNSDTDGALIHGTKSGKSMKIWMPFVKRSLNLFFLDKNMMVIKNGIAAPITLDPKTWKTYECENAIFCLELKDLKAPIKTGTRIKKLSQGYSKPTK